MRNFGRSLRWLVLSLGCVWALAAGGWATTAVEVEGGFGRNTGGIDPVGFGRLHEHVQLWDSWQGDDAKTGSIRFGPLTLQDEFSAYVLGFPNDTTLTLGWEDQDGRRLLLAPRHAPEHRWMLGRWAVPEEWRGRSVRFFAEDRTGGGYGWLGVSEPVEVAPPVLSVGRLIGWHALIFALLLLPGLGLAVWLCRADESVERAVAVVLVAGGVCAYGCYFVYYWSAPVGRALSWSLLAMGAAALLWRVRREGIAGWWREAAGPAALVYATSLMYLAVLFLYGGADTPETVPMDRMLVRLPPDTILPMWVADLMAAGQRPVGFLGDWLSSDRPPLQSGFYLLLHPVIGGAFGYQILGVVLQCWVLAGMWVLLRVFAIPARTQTWVLFGAVFSGFFVFNGTFVWPKLLPAAYLLIVVAGLFGGRDRWAGLIGAAAALAMLGHGGSAFGIMGVGLCSLLMPPKSKWRVWITVAAVGAVLMVPWSLYQKFADPPGNRLLKWHLAGAVPVDSRPLGQTLREAYAAKTLGEIARDRWTNIVMLVHRDETPCWTGFRNAWASGRNYGSEIGWRNAVYYARELAFFHVFHSPQTWLLGLLGAWLLWRERRASRASAWRLAGLMLALVAATSLSWCALMFEPGSTGNHQGSYFNNACWFVALGLGMAALPAVWRWGAALLHLLVFAGGWVYAFPHSHHLAVRLPKWENGMLVLAIVAAFLVLASLALVGGRRSGRESG